MDLIKYRQQGIKARDEIKEIIHGLELCSRNGSESSADEETFDYVLNTLKELRSKNSNLSKLVNQSGVLGLYGNKSTMQEMAKEIKRYIQHIDINHIRVTGSKSCLAAQAMVDVFNIFLTIKPDSSSTNEAHHIVPKREHLQNQIEEYLRSTPKNTHF